MEEYLDAAFTYINIDRAAIALDVCRNDGAAACAHFLIDAFLDFPFDIKIIFGMMEHQGMDAYAQYFQMVYSFNAHGYGIFTARQLTQGITALALDNMEELELLCAEVALCIGKKL